LSGEIDAVFERMFGLPCWGVHWDAQTGLRLNFGEPHLETREPKEMPPESRLKTLYTYRSVHVYGEWVLWIDGLWRLASATSNR